MTIKTVRDQHGRPVDFPGGVIVHLQRDELAALAKFAGETITRRWSRLDDVALESALIAVVGQHRRAVVLAEAAQAVVDDADGIAAVDEWLREPSEADV